MNTNPDAKVVLCYGDSNTWGANPLNGQRYAADKRWPGVVQHILSNGYSIIEEGLSGRTTIYSNASRPWENGKLHLMPALISHAPLDMVVFMLGTNDVLAWYAVDDSAIGIGMEDLVQVIHHAQAGRNGGEPKILIVAPPVIKEKAAVDDADMKDGPRKSMLFAERYQAVAARNNCLFFDANRVIHSSDADGYHLNESAHHALGKAIAEIIKQELP